MQMFVKSILGATISVTVESSSTIYQVKLQVQAKTQNSPDNMKLIFAGRLLNNCHTLEYYNIQECSTLHLVMFCRGGMHHAISSRVDENKPYVYIDDETNRDIIKFNVDLNDSVFNLKLQLQAVDSINVTASCQDLIFNDVSLVNFKRLAHYSVTCGSYLIMRSRNGISNLVNVGEMSEK